MSFKSGDLVTYTINDRNGLAWVNSSDLGGGRYRVIPIDRVGRITYLYGLDGSQMTIHTKSEDVVQPFNSFEVLESLGLTR